MENLTEAIIELIRRTSTDLPQDVEISIQTAMQQEEVGSAAYGALEAILKNVDISRRNQTPICQDTGTPIFYVNYPEGFSMMKLRKQIEDAVAQATQLSYLRPNSVEAISGKNTGNNLGDEHFPSFHFIEQANNELTIELMLKGGGCENVGSQYSLPNDDLNAGRDLAGVRKVVLHAIHQAQGQGCAPGILGIAIGGDRGSSYIASKQVLYKKLGERNPNAQLAELEERLTNEANQLGIGPMGFGGKTTILDTKIISMHRLPASFFVTISYMCWAYRHRKMTVVTGQISFD
jgi:fumarate hydratase class I